MIFIPPPPTSRQIGRKLGKLLATMRKLQTPVKPQPTTPQHTMITTTQRPTPMTDQIEASLAKSSNVRRYYAALAQMRLMEVERDEAREALEAMREAIKDAHYALAYVYNHGEGSCAFPYRTEDDLCSENRFHHVKDALDSLKPFLP